MTDPELIALVERMRALQRRYFRERTQQALQESKDAERRVDDALRLRKAGPGLWDVPAEGGISNG